MKNNPEIFSGNDFSLETPPNECYYSWECPECGDVCEDPNDFRETVCHNGHEVLLGHADDNGFQEAHLIKK